MIDLKNLTVHLSIYPSIQPSKSIRSPLILYIIIIITIYLYKYHYVTYSLWYKYLLLRTEVFAVHV